MPSAQRLQKTSVIEGLQNQPASFEFFQAVRVLQLHLKQKNQLSADHVLNELINFKSSLSLAFPKSEIESLSEREGCYVLVPTMFGLTGNSGALPLVYSQKLASSLWARKNGSLAFLDLFNNRLINLFYQAAIKHNLPLQSELNPEKSYLSCIHAIEGYIADQKSLRDDLIDHSLAEFSGLVQGQMLNVESIQQILRSVLKQQVNINQFIPEWFVIPQEHRSGLSSLGGVQLGVNSFCGDRVKQIDSKIQLEIGPLDYADYSALLPSGHLYPVLKKLLKRVCNPTLIIEVILIINKRAVQPIVLGKNLTQGIGRGSFLISQPVEQHQSQTKFLLH